MTADERKPYVHQHIKAKQTSYIELDSFRELKNDKHFFAPADTKVLKKVGCKRKYEDRSEPDAEVKELPCVFYASITATSTSTTLIAPQAEKCISPSLLAALSVVNFCETNVPVSSLTQPPPQPSLFGSV